VSLTGRSKLFSMASPGAQIKDKIGQLETRKAELDRFLADAEEPPPLLHPSMRRSTNRGWRAVSIRPGPQVSRFSTPGVEAGRDYFCRF
jgi:hypothetical protein